MRIRKAAEFTRKLNTLLELLVQGSLLVDGMPGFGGSHRFDDDTRDLVREFVRAKERFAVLEPGRIEVRLPMSKADHAWFLGQIEQRVFRNTSTEIVRRRLVADHRQAGGDPTETSVGNVDVPLDAEKLPAELRRAPTARFLFDHEWSLIRTAERTTVVLGTGEGAELRAHKASDGLYHPALLEKLREAKEPIEDGLPDQELERRFVAFRAREAVLPPKVAALRASKVAEPAKTEGGK